MATKKSQTPRPSDVLAPTASAPHEADGSDSGAINATAIHTPTQYLSVLSYLRNKWAV